MNNIELQKKLKYEFKNPQLLEKALNHSSYVNEKGVTRFDSNERLEFLGDAMLESFISLTLFNRLPYMEEGDLTKLRAYIVCERSLYRCALGISLGEHINLGRGEASSGGRKRPSIVADAMEALIGAVFLDGGREAAESFVMRIFESAIEEAISGVAGSDYKSRLQELLQSEGQINIQYKVDREEGPDHNKVFYVSAFRGEDKIGAGTGKSKKQAEQNAAKYALESIRQKEPPTG